MGERPGQTHRTSIKPDAGDGDPEREISSVVDEPQQAAISRVSLLIDF